MTGAAHRLVHLQTQPAARRADALAGGALGWFRGLRPAHRSRATSQASDPSDAPSTICVYHRSITVGAQATSVFASST